MLREVGGPKALDATTGQPVGIATKTDITHAVADGKDLNETRIHELMTRNLTVVPSTATIRNAAKLMTSRHFRHLPVTGDTCLAGMVDITEVCRALISPDVSGGLPPTPPGRRSPRDVAIQQASAA